MVISLLFQASSYEYGIDSLFRVDSVVSSEISSWLSQLIAILYSSEAPQHKLIVI